MKFILGLLLTSLLTLLSLAGLPWWTVVLAGLVTALLIRQSFGATFLSSFLGGGLTWLITAVLLDQANNGLLSAKIAQLFSLSTSSSLLLATAIVGALGAGIGAILGYELTKFVRTPSKPTEKRIAKER